MVQQPSYDDKGRVVSVTVMHGQWVVYASRSDGDVVVSYTGDDIVNGNLSHKDKVLSVELRQRLPVDHYLVTQDITISEPNEAGEAGENPVRVRYLNNFSVRRGDCNGDGKIDPEVKMVPIGRRP